MGKNIKKQHCAECGVESKNLKLVEIKNADNKTVKVYVCKSCEKELMA